MTKHIALLISSLLLSTATAFSQGGNTGFGDGDKESESLSARLLHLEKKTDAFNLYINAAASAQATQTGENWDGAFRARHLRVEMKGQIGDRIHYRLRHRLNAPNAQNSLEGFSDATDIMMIGWKINEHWALSGGKMCQFWGGFEFDENPLYIYRYSDLLSHMEVFFAGAAISWTPLKSQEFVLNVANSFNHSFSETFGPAPVTVAGNAISLAAVPLTYILNWNGHFLDGRLKTRWGAGVITEARGRYSKMAFLGQALSLSRFQIYLDYMGAWEDVDHFGIASAELGALQEKVNYNSLVLKANWQPLPRLNLMGKGMYETATAPGAGTYRQSVGYAAAIEYFPADGQDLRIFLAASGNERKFTTDIINPIRHELRIELGFMYRLKAF